MKSGYQKMVGYGLMFFLGALFTLAMTHSPLKASGQRECDAHLDMSHLYADYRCPNNYVMTGRISDNIYCAKIKVTCSE
jgi:hypothetical protein